MLFPSYIVLVFIASFAAGQTSEPQVSNLLPQLEESNADALDLARGRSDIDIEDEEPSQGYFYPKPAKPFLLPEFKTLNAELPLDETSSEQLERERRSPRRGRPNYYPRPPYPPPQFGHGPSNLLPHHIRPLPALYARPQLY